MFPAKRAGSASVTNARALSTSIFVGAPPMEPKLPSSASKIAACVSTRLGKKTFRRLKPSVRQKTTTRVVSPPKDTV